MVFDQSFAPMSADIFEVVGMSGTDCWVIVYISKLNDLFAHHTRNIAFLTPRQAIVATSEAGKR
jgi:hypothetical protein